jgi:4-oxalocrotonate tautomerase family enzyme
VVVIQITLNLGRTLEQKRALYRTIADKLTASPGLRREDILVSLVEVPKENWSFGNGEMSYVK